jgi:hypothetical protein
MSLLRAGTQFISVSLVVIFWVSPVKAQSNQSSAQVQAQGQAQAASKVSAEMVKGKLNPASSKPGDQVTVRMAEDVKSNGQVVLKKGTEVNGVVRSVKRAESKADAKAQSSAQAAAQSMIQVEWLVPAGSGAAAQQLNFALSSIAYTNPLYANQQAQESAAADGGIAAPRPAPAPARGGGGLVGGATGVAGGVAGGASSTVGAAGNVAGRAGAASQASAGLLALPAPVAASSQTATSLQNNFGVSSNQLLMTGHGQAVSAGGTSSSMDLFTHMSNDAVITSPSRDFEIASGAQMQFMVSAKGQK